jgi:hypothetical protein
MEKELVLKTKDGKKLFTKLRGSLKKPAIVIVEEVI